MLDALASPVGHLLRLIHSGLSTFLAPASGLAWGMSIVLLTMLVRLVLFPLFVKQIKSQRRMQELAPKVKELQAKHKGDRETLNVELMKLYKEHGANPISGCLPLLLQLPVFFALFTVIREFKPDARARFGLTAEQLSEGARAKIFGAPISAAFNSPSELLNELGSDATVVRVVAMIMVLVMGGTTYWTQRQMMARAGTGDPQTQQIQKIMLYFLPLSIAISGFFFPVGVLLYWLTTNIWSMGQQAWVIKNMPPIDAKDAKAAQGAGGKGGTGPAKGGKDGKGGGPAGPSSGPGKGGRGGPGKGGKGGPAGSTVLRPATDDGRADGDGDGDETTTSEKQPVTAGSSGGRPSGSGTRRQSGSKKRKGRPGGRR